MSVLGILVIIGLCTLAVVALIAVAVTIVVFIRDWRQDAQAGKHAAAPQNDPGWGEKPREIASEPPTEILTAPIAPPWSPAAAPTAGPPPVLHHDEFGPDQRWHDEPEAPAVDEAHQAALAVGALIAATNARAAEKDRARAAELEAEARETRPWADDTGTFSAICAQVA